jgi:hypothetical protein
MPCQPCAERKARLEALATEGEQLPVRDYAFYAGWLLALTGAAAVIYLLRRQS